MLRRIRELRFNKERARTENFARAELERAIALIERSGSFSQAWYEAKHPDVAESGVDALHHYYCLGADEGRDPSYLFSSSRYQALYEDVRKAGLNPLHHYLRYGEEEGRSASSFFDAVFYRSQFPKGHCPHSLLGHFLSGGWRHYSPNAYFDVGFYLATHRDVADAGMDPLHHYLVQGWTEGREIHPTLSFAGYGQELEKRLGVRVNPLLHYVEVGEAAGDLVPGHAPAPVCEPVRQLPLGEMLRAASLPGPHYEDALIGGGHVLASVKTRLFAFYLPQFYPFEENDKWWGKGFTEWRNVTRATPRFEGHQQPRIPRENGFYDLRNVETIASQVEMARMSGVTGFCFYYYWFDRKRLLDRPLDLFLENPDIQFPFCLMWANENWTRRWDGQEQDVLIEQTYRSEDDVAFVDDLAKYFHDERYERVNGRPLFIIYRPGVVKNFREMLATWRRLFNERHGLNPLILMAQGFGDHDPTSFGLDGAIEFPPHKLAVNLPLAPEMASRAPGFEGHYMRYDDLVCASRSIAEPSFDLVRTLVPSWDNEARRPARGMGFVGATPDKYERWLRHLVQWSQQRPLAGADPYVFVNAWNEWAEGAHLEPDLHHGVAYLNATYRALAGIRKAAKSPMHVLFVGHDAYRHGAQLLALNIVKTLREEFGVTVTMLLLQGGPLVAEYEKYAEVRVVGEHFRTVEEAVDSLAAAHETRVAITNTTVCGKVMEPLSKHDYSVVSLVHELGRLIHDYRLEESAAAIAKHSESVVFASPVVKASFEQVAGALHGRGLILPQGIYQSVVFDETRYADLRLKLGLPSDARVVLNLGYGDLRKGFDLFVQLALHVTSRQPDCHFVWLGNIDENLKLWLAGDIQSRLSECFHVLPFDPDVDSYLNGTDVLALTSREDPFPSVVLEALACGVPVVGFAEGGGFVDVINADRNNGQVVPMADIEKMGAAVLALLGEPDWLDARRERAERIADQYDWKDYVFSLLQVLKPELRKVTAVVPNYNYAAYLPERLSSVFGQEYPLYEVIVLDDASTDNSLAVVAEVAACHQRKVRIVPSKVNSKSVFRQWNRGVTLAKGEFVWIAEADDSARPQFVSSLVDQMTDAAVMGFSDSAQVDAHGNSLGDSYQFYYKDLPANMLSKDCVISGEEFVSRVLAIKNVVLNVSSVIFRREKLAKLFERSLETICAYKMAGDWHLYCELLAGNGCDVVYVNQPNNIHRRHATSVTHALNSALHLQEIARVQVYAANVADVDNHISAAAEAYLRSVTVQLTQVHE